MSQDINTNSNGSRRTARSRRNRPTLVTPGAEQQQEVVQETPAVESVAVVEPPPAPKRRLPGFFSTVGKSEAEAASNETDVAKARLARATRGKTTSTTGKAANAADTPAVKPEASKPAATSGVARSAAPQRPPSLFKPRYILGMVIYLVAANFLGNIERSALVSIGAERVLTKLNLFGLPLIVTTSGLTFIATLIIVLVVLAKLDLLPTKLSSMTNTPPPKKGSSSQTRRSVGEEGTRNVPPPIRQGVQGADDELYRSYRTNQRRDKKR